MILFRRHCHHSTLIVPLLFSPTILAELEYLKMELDEKGRGHSWNARDIWRIRNLVRPMAAMILDCQRLQTFEEI